MLARQRQAMILERVRQNGAVRVADLTEELAVSDMTIRRDLEHLAGQGLIEKVHGGATALAEHSTDEPGFAVKSFRQQPEKEAIAALAARLVAPGTAIGITGGTTTAALARHLSKIPRLTVVTNSLPVADTLHASARSDVTVVLTGGVRTPSDALVGPVALATIRSLHLDLLFMGVHGMDPHSGFTSPNLMEAETNAAFITASRRLVVVADHSKWGIVGLATIAELDAADTLITDPQIATDAHEELAARIDDVQLAG